MEYIYKLVELIAVKVIVFSVNANNNINKVKSLFGFSHTFAVLIAVSSSCAYSCYQLENSFSNTNKKQNDYSNMHSTYPTPSKH